MKEQCELEEELGLKVSLQILLKHNSPHSAAGPSSSIAHRCLIISVKSSIAKQNLSALASIQRDNVYRDFIFDDTTLLSVSSPLNLKHLNISSADSFSFRFSLCFVSFCGFKNLFETEIAEQQKKIYLSGSYSKWQR
ncbi:hypothetical protein RYX36_028127 [Vicia faba]